VFKTRLSSWKFETCAGFNLTSGLTIKKDPTNFISVDGRYGYFVLINPWSRRRITFNYSFFLEGLSLSPSFMPNLGGSGSVEQTQSDGWLYMGEGFHGKELSPSDLEGVTIVQEYSRSLSWGRGRAFTMFLLGLSRTDFAFALAQTGSLPVIEKYPEIIGLAGFGLSKLTKSVHRGPKAVLLIDGRSYGVQMGASGMMGLGYVHMGAARLPHSDPAKPIDTPPIPIESEDVTISSRSTQLDIMIPGDILFMFDDDQFKTETTKKPAPSAVEVQATRDGLTKIENQFRKLRLSPTQVVVYGHTDSKERTFGWNQGLSERRATTLRHWLVRKNLVPSSKIITIGMAARHPIASNDTDDGRAKNRRVEIKVSF